MIFSCDFLSLLLKYDIFQIFPDDEPIVDSGEDTADETTEEKKEIETIVISDDESDDDTVLPYIPGTGGHKVCCSLSKK
jgi:hypothetical protein